jgi:hypothetical protein
MTWSYSGNPNTTDRDAVRFLIGDTDYDDQLLSDEELAFVLTDEPDVRRAASRAAEAVAAKFARRADSSKSVGDLSLSESWSQRAAQFMELASRLLAQANLAVHPRAVAAERALGAEFEIGEMDWFISDLYGYGRRRGETPSGL